MNFTKRLDHTLNFNFEQNFYEIYWNNHIHIHDWNIIGYWQYTTKIALLKNIGFLFQQHILYSSTPNACNISRFRSPVVHFSNMLTQV